jgi:hypothetical protein
MAHQTTHTQCRQAFHDLCQYYAEHIAYQHSTPAQQAEYTCREAVYKHLQRLVDTAAIARYEQI